MIILVGTNETNRAAESMNFVKQWELYSEKLSEGEEAEDTDTEVGDEIIEKAENGTESTTTILNEQIDQAVTRED